MSYREHEIENADGLENGEMRQVAAGDTEVLVARVDGRLCAVAAHCTHYGAPLADGVLHGNRLVCPWHHACFDVTTGSLLEPPAIDGLARYEVVEENGRAAVRIPEGAPDRETAEMATPDPAADGRTFAIVGGGAAGYAAAQALREEGFRGRIVMITREERSPYDRPNLSKDYLAGHAEPEWMPLRPDEFYDEHGIELLRGREVTTLDASAKTIAFAGGETIAFDAALVATGGDPRTPPIPGIDLDGVFLLRSFADADAIVHAATGAARAVVVGASFIGMETASSLVARDLAVTVVAPDAVPFEKSLGREIGEMLQRLHESKGVTFELKTTVERIEGDGRMTAVVLGNGSRLEADLVVVGAGVRPATGFLKGVVLREDGGVVVDDRMRAAEGVWAAGDIASFPDPRSGERVRIEHWRTAEQLGRVAAANMAGRDLAYTSAPFFWTRQHDVGLQYVGHAAEWDEIVVDGEIAKRDFLALYVKGDRILAAAGCNRDRDLGAISELMRIDRMPSSGEARSGAVDWLARLSGA